MVIGLFLSGRIEMFLIRCKRCGAFVKPDHESNADRIHYHCINCESTGYIENYE